MCATDKVLAAMICRAHNHILQVQQALAIKKSCHLLDHVNQVGGIRKVFLADPA